MKLKLIVILSVVALASVIFGAACSRSSKEAAPADGQKISHYTCPMHPSVKADKPGDCPICGMHLVPVYETGKDTNAPPAATKTNTLAMMSGCCSMGMSH